MLYTVARWAEAESASAGRALRSASNPLVAQQVVQRRGDEARVLLNLGRRCRRLSETEDRPRNRNRLR